MTLQEIQYKAQAIMQKWRDEDSAPYVEFVEELALMGVPAESEDERIRKLLVWQVYRNIEDEINDLAGSVYDGIKGHDPDIEESIEDWKKCLAWLEKQKEQKPAEWSESDEGYLQLVIGLVKSDIGENSHAVRWMKSLRSRLSWKPSEKQMKALQNAIALTACDKELVGLYEQLEELK